MRIIPILKKTVKLIKLSLIILKYNQYNRAELFRKQGAQIGEDCHLGISSLASEPFLVKIGNHVGIATGVQLLTHSLGWNFRDRIPDIQVFGKIVIEDNCNIGVNAIILPDVTIGENCIVAAGSVVTKDVLPNSMVGGCPAKVIGNTEDYFERIKESWKIQKPKDYASEMIEGKYYSPQYFDRIRSMPKNRKKLRTHLVKLFWD